MSVSTISGITLTWLLMPEEQAAPILNKTKPEPAPRGGLGQAVFDACDGDYEVANQARERAGRGGGGLWCAGAGSV